MIFPEIVIEEACAVGVVVKNSDEVLREIARRAAALPALRNVSENDIFLCLKAREEQGSTGIAGGVAIPHVRLKEIDDFVLFIITAAEGIEFHAQDGELTRLFFVILGPDDKADDFLHLLAAVSNTVVHGNLKQRLLGAADGIELKRLFLAKVSELEGPAEGQKMKLLMVILHQEHFFYDVLQYFLQQNIHNATVFDSSGIDRFVAKIPLFSSFFDFINERKHHSRTIVALIAENRLDIIVRGIERITGDLEIGRSGMIVALDPFFCKGQIKQ